MESHWNRKLNETLRGIELWRTGFPAVSWSGILSNKPNGNLSIVLESSADLWGVLENGPSGIIVSKDQLFMVRAVTEHGLRLEAADLYPSDRRTFPHGSSRLEFQPRRLTVSSETNPGESPGIIGAINEFDQKYACWCSERIAWPPVIATEAQWHQWYCLKFQDTWFALSKARHPYCQFALWTEGQAEPLNLEAQAKAFLFALGFRLGQRVDWLGYTHRMADRQETVLMDPVPVRPGFQHSPLPSDIREGDEQMLLRCACAFFSHPQNFPVVNLLGMLWDTADNFFPVQSLVAATVIEGLASFILQGSKTSSAAKDFELRKDHLCKYLGEHRDCLAGAESQEEGLAFLVKMQNVIKTTQMFSLGEKVLQAAIKLEVQVGDEELRAWKQMRSPLAHGRFPSGPLSETEVQLQSHQLDCAASIINKFVFGLIGYSGDYQDFSTPGWPTRRVTPSVPLGTESQ